MEIDREYLGYELLNRDFEIWFRYMFRIVEGTPFIVEPIHLDLFKSFQSVYDGEITRINFNIPPRGGKTTLTKYFLVYCVTKNAKCNFIYTSFSQQLLDDIARSVMAILEHPAYQAMYNNYVSVEETEVSPIDEFWADYLFDTQKKTVYSQKRIVTKDGGVLLFTSIGSTITGFGAGVRGAVKFSGALLIDDANKPADIHSQTMRERVIRYYEETLLTRLNGSNIPIMNIQQRLHLEDLSGILSEKYGFKTLSKPLLVDGVCQLPKQYTAERLEELQKNNYMFSAQYQQTPIKLGGNLIKSEYFQRFESEPAKFDYMFIVADTAFSEKKSADNSAFGLFGGIGNKLYMLDGYCKKVIFPDLRRDLKSFYLRAKEKYTTCTISTIYIENKGSGISLIQQLREDGLPISELMPTVHNAELKKDQVADKFLRFNEIAADLESGYFYIPVAAPWLSEFIHECESFTGGKQDTHDDYVDVLIYALKKRRSIQSTDWNALRNSLMMRR